ncbi:MAG: DUF1735 domain-containing protein [Flavobacterium sp.]|nr:MAG: DUF1735 domain-containing protein [Flavobacterium sp.]
MKRNILKTLSLLLTISCFTSCLKDDSMVLDPEKAGANLVDFQNPGDIVIHGSTTPLYVFSFPISTTPTLVPLTVAYSGAEDAAPNDITVNIGLAAQSVIDQYNTEQKVALNAMPASWYTLSATSVVIPKGKKTATFNVAVKTDMIDLTKSYVVPLKLTSPNALVSSNFGTALFQVGAKNKYDGIYSSVAGNIQRYSSPGNPTTGDALNGSLAANPDLTLVTIDANTVSILNYKWGNNQGGIGGIDGLYAKVDPVTNQVTMSSVLRPDLVNMPGKENKYDPATKTYTLNFWWNQAGATREITNWQFKYKGPRP